MKLNFKSNAGLNNGVQIPRLGFGTWRLAPGEETVMGVSCALEAGYRHIDTASQYGNEESVGIAIQKSAIPESEIFVTTKLWDDDHGFDSVQRAFETSRKKLQLEIIDLYLIHFPVKAHLRQETWRGMEAVLETGMCRSIGVSNFSVQQLEEIFSFCKVPPAANQIELHPYMYRAQKEVIEFCQNKRIAIEAYRPLTKGVKFNDERITSIAARYGKSPAQVLIRWSLDHGFVVIPKSSHRERILENCDLYDFELTAEEIQSLDSFETITFMPPKQTA